MLSTGEVFSPTDLADIETPVELRINYISNNFKQSVKQLKSVGLTTEQILELLHPVSEESEASPA